MQYPYNFSTCSKEKEVGQLDNWTLEGVAKHINVERFIATAMNSNLPPWRPIPSRAAARMLGISLQSLANWRMRDLGPKPEPWKKGGGNRVYYRPDRLVEWLSGGRFSGWEFSGRWLQVKGMIPSEAIKPDLVRATIEGMESLDLFPPVHGLWRSFREAEPY
jgi:hypothetical protein